MSIVYPVDQPKPKPINAEQLPKPETAPEATPQDVLADELSRAEETKKQERTAKWRAQGRDENGVLLGSSLIELERVKQAKAAAFEELQKTNPTDFSVIQSLWCGDKVDVVNLNRIMYDDFSRYAELKELGIKIGVLPDGYRISDPVAKRKPGNEVPLAKVMEEFPEINISTADRMALRAMFGDERHKSVTGFAQKLARENPTEYARLRDLKLGPMTPPSKAFTYRPDAK